MANSVDNLLFVIGYMRSEIENLKDVSQRYKNIINEQRTILLERGERIKKLEKELTDLKALNYLRKKLEANEEEEK